MYLYINSLSVSQETFNDKRFEISSRTSYVRHDNKYPKSPIVIISNKDETQVKIANELYDFLKQNHIDVILDDREERPGVKFKDMDLIGIPLRVTIGKKAVDNIVEFKERTKADREELTLEEVKAKIIELVNE